MALAPARGIQLRELRFDNRFAALGDAFSESRLPDGLTDARLIAGSDGAAALLGLDPAELHSGELVRVAAGTALVRGMEPRAALYAGHQFGSWNPQLGDGRAILLGTAVTPSGPLDVQLKGAGRTAYSRFGDGRAVLRSSLREFLASEHLAALGVPTTRALAVVASNDPVMRETVETAAIVVRLAPSFVRFGSFEIFASRDQLAELRTLADHVIDGWFPECGTGDDRYARFFSEVVRRTAELVAAWQAIGFEHGVLNTDNMSILGLTLDYGPFGFLEAYDPQWICNHSDEGGRYAFDQQPTIGRWNLFALGHALQSLVPREALDAALETYVPVLRDAYASRMRARLGLDGVREGDLALIGDLLQLAQRDGADYSRLLRGLADVNPSAGAGPWLDDARLQRREDDVAWNAWLARYVTRKADDQRARHERRAAMHAVNPRYVLRNWVAQVAIDAAASSDLATVDRIFAVFTQPYDEHPGAAAWSEPAPEPYRGLEVSCSS